MYNQPRIGTRYVSFDPIFLYFLIYILKPKKSIICKMSKYTNHINIKINDHVKYEK